MKKFLIQGDANGASTFAIPFCDYIDVRVLAAGAAETVTVPEGARIVVMSSTADFYASITGTAAIPSADITDGSGSELNPTARVVQNIESFSVVAADGAVLTLSFFG